MFSAAARAYIEIQRKHAELEDAQILPLAREVLTPEDDELILAEYEHLERRHLQAGERTPIERAQRLCASVARQVLDRQAALLSSPVRDLHGRRPGQRDLVRA
jgi:hemerythrin-like domain-containing protein